MSTTQTNNNPCSQGEVLRMGTHRKLKVKWTKNNTLSYEFFRAPLSTSLARLLDVKSFQFFPSSLQTMKKRFFVIRGESENSCNCLEYYESERKYKLHQAPKKIIKLKYCFNINKRNDLKIKNVLSLYTKSDCLSIIFDKEEVCNDWLKTLLALQFGSDFTESEELRPQFAHVWHVNMQKRELGNSKNILGPHLLCLTDRTLSLIKITGEDEPSPENLNFPLSSIRRCGDFSSFLYVEVGQMSVTGPGNLWMEAEDEVIAKNMHHAIMNVCASSSSRKTDLLPKSRTRSFSINEASKPIEVSRGSYGDTRSHYKAPTPTEASGFATSPVSVNESMGFLEHAHSVGGENLTVHHQRTLSDPLSPLPSLIARRASTGNGPNFKRTSASSLNNNNSNMRERCDSMPSRARSNTETSHTQGGSRIGHSARSHAAYARGLSYSPPVASSPVSPQSGGCSTDSAGSSLSMDGDGEPWNGDDSTANENSFVLDIGAGRYCHSVTPDEPVIMEENSDDYVQWSGEDAKLNNYMPMDRSTTGNFSLQIIQPATILSNASYRKQPLSNSSFKSHSPSQGSFSDSFLPNNSSLADQSGYTPMSPGEGEDTIDGYVPMAPSFRDDGYVNMNSNLNKKKGGSHSLAGSSTSITSGTPSTDLRFSEYHLDKVKSYFSPVEDEHEEQRPTRAYSIGSRPEKFKNKNARMEHVDKSDNLRVRAFSVGSRPNIRPNIPKKHPSCFVSSSLSSMEQSDDLMEIDFSQINKKSKKKKSQEHLIVPSAMSSSASSYSTAEGSCMDISPRCSPKLVASCGTKGSPDSVPSPPRPVFSKSYVGRSPPKGSHHSLLDHHLPRLSPPGHGYYISPTLHKVSEAPVGYVDMCPGTGGELLLAVSPPRHVTNTTQGDSSTSSYVDMKPGSESQQRQPKKETANPRPQNFPTIKPALLSTVGKVPHLPKWDSKQESTTEESQASDYIEVDMKKKVSGSEDNNNSKSGCIVAGAATDSSKQASEAYVEMTWNSPKANAEKQSSNENQDYINMNLDREKRKDAKSRRILNKGRYSSQPISIKANISNDDSSITSPLSASMARKFSTGASSKIPSFLPVGFKSVTRWDSKESSSSNSGVSTPTNSNSTMFPLILSCPTSPSQDNYEMCPKIPVDATSGTVKISYPADSHTSSSSASKSLESVQEVDHTSDYVNYNPKSSVLEENSNYTVMKPRKTPPSISRKSSVPANLGTSSKNKMLDKLQKSLTCLTISSSLTSSSSSTSNKQKNSGHSSSVNNNSNVDNCNNSSSTSNPNDNNCNYSNISANNTNTPQNQTKVPNVATTNDFVCFPLNTAATKSAVSMVAKQPETSTTTTVPAFSQSLSISNSSESLKADDKVELKRQISSSSGSCSDASIVSATPFFGSIKPPTISHEKEIQYATLDLARSDSEEGIAKSESGLKSSVDQSANQPTYAEIDFSKSASTAGMSTCDSNQRH